MYFSRTNSFRANDPPLCSPTSNEHGYPYSKIPSSRVFSPSTHPESIDRNERFNEQQIPIGMDIEHARRKSRFSREGEAQPSEKIKQLVHGSAFYSIQAVRSHAMTDLGRKRTNRD